MKIKILFFSYLVLQNLQITSVLGQSPERPLYHANVVAFSKQHKNLYASISVNINSKSKAKPPETLKTSKNFTDPKNGWTLTFQEEYGIQFQDWPVEKSDESPIIAPQAHKAPQAPKEPQAPQHLKQQTSDRKCKKSITESSCQNVCKGDLIFEDNFDTLNTSIWHHEVRIAMGFSEDNEFVSYQNRSENCYVNDGHLFIEPTLLTDIPGYKSLYKATLDLGSQCTAFQDEECTLTTKSQILPPVVSARIRTKRSFEFRFGRIEVNASMPKGDWLFPLILLEPSENMYGFDNYASGQMRVAFTRGNLERFDPYGPDISQLHGGIIVHAGYAYRDIFLAKRRVHFTDTFHVYALTWTDKKITLELDGQVYATFSDTFMDSAPMYKINSSRLWSKGEYLAPFDRKFFITLGVGAGGCSDFPDNMSNLKSTYKKPWDNGSPKAATQFWKAKKQWYETWKKENFGLRVDYVRVFAV